jgi:hypothetical protein
LSFVGEGSEDAAMSQTAEELKQELKKRVDTLTTLRDEVRVRLHLAGLDAKTQWTKLEPRIAEVERDIAVAAEDVSTVTRDALTDVIAKLQRLRDSMH